MKRRNAQPYGAEPNMVHIRGKCSLTSTPRLEKEAQRG